MARLLVLLLALAVEGTVALSAPHRPPPQPEQIAFRPHSGFEADILHHGIFCRSVTDINMLDGTFAADFVVTLHWTDRRAASVVPAGVTEVTMAERFARKRIWIPDVTLTNRHIFGMDPISTAFTVDIWGNVTKVQRIIATLNNAYDVTNFPFDKQRLTVKLGSTFLMSNQLKFVPDPAMMGMADGVFSNSDFSLIGFSAAVEDEVDGDLRKSRGTFSIRIERLYLPYLQSHILHEVLMMFISWSVYWYPLTAPFAMPRVFTALISFLTLIMMGTKTTMLIPVRGTFSWISLFQANCQTLMFINIWLNVFILTIDHAFGHQKRAEMIEREAFLFFPSVTCIILSICIFTSAETASVDILGVVCSCLIVVFFFSFVGYEAWDLKHAMKSKDTSRPVRRWNFNSVPCPT